MSKRNQAFTLIELLVVISIIALLLAIIMPSLNKARIAGNSVVCLSQLRQFQIASQMYSRDNNDLILPAYQPNNIYCWQLMDPYIETNLWNDVGDGNRVVTLRCTGFTAQRRNEPRFNWWGSTGYGTNLHFNSASGLAGREVKENYTNPPKLTIIKSVASTVQFYDTDQTANDQNGPCGGYTMDSPKGNPWFYTLWKSHGDYFNISIFDGHAEKVMFNPEGKHRGSGSGDYEQFTWLPYGPYGK